MAEAQRPDIIVIGASSGGLERKSRMVEEQADLIRGLLLSGQIKAQGETE